MFKTFRLGLLAGVAVLAAALASVAPAQAAGPTCGIADGQVVKVRPQSGQQDFQTKECAGGSCARLFVNTDGYVTVCPEWVATGQDVATPKPLAEQTCPAGAGHVRWGGEQGDACHSSPSNGREAKARPNLLPVATTGTPATVINFVPGTKGYRIYECQHGPAGLGRWVVVVERCDKRR